MLSKKHARHKREHIYGPKYVKNLKLDKTNLDYFKSRSWLALVEMEGVLVRRMFGVHVDLSDGYGTVSSECKNSYSSTLMICALPSILFQ